MSEGAGRQYRRKERLAARRRAGWISAKAAHRKRLRIRRARAMVQAALAAARVGA